MPRVPLTAFLARMKKRLGSRRAIAIVIAVGALEIAGVLLALSAWAGSGVRNSSCVGSYGTVACTTNWRWTYGDEPGVILSRTPDARDERDAAERDRKWLARCRPVIRHDQYGVSRYSYAAPGCEFGRSED